MNVVAKTIGEIAYSKTTAVIGTIASIVSFGWVVYEQYILKSDSIAPVALLICVTLIYCVICFYSVLIRQENLIFEQIPQKIHEVNHIYRNKLREVFSGKNPIDKRSDLVDIEESVLRSVCQRIEKIFSRLVGDDCVVTIKLITTKNGQRLAETYIRSIDDCPRDDKGFSSYEIGTGENTAFDEALKIEVNNKVSHFYSPDLEKDKKEKKYNNQRSNFGEYYRSAIVVPIRCKTGANATDDIGFLCVDTKAINRLKPGYQVHLMASFADQMYNFMCLMRGNYSVLVD